MVSSKQENQPASKPDLSPEAKRALQEADIRRAEKDKTAKQRPPETAGRNGPEPTRYGDWEKNGLISDF